MARNAPPGSAPSRTSQPGSKRGSGIQPVVSLPGSRRASGAGGQSSAPHSRTQSSTTSTTAPEDASPALASDGPVASTSRDLSSLLGLSVRLTLVGPPERTVEGAVFAVDTRTGFVALECAPSTTSTSTSSSSTAAFAPGAGKKGATPGMGAGAKADYRLVRLAQIKAVQPLLDVPPPIDRPPIQPRAVSIAAVQQIEAQAARAEEQRLARLGPPGVSAFGQDIYDALAKTLPVRWQQMTIVVLDDCHVSPPYEVATGLASSKLERVQKVLEGERQRLLKLAA